MAQDHNPSLLVVRRNEPLAARFVAQLGPPAQRAELSATGHLVLDDRHAPVAAPADFRHSASACGLTSGRFRIGCSPVRLVRLQLELDRLIGGLAEFGDEPA